jgi:pimeloyl-ACP methyl ester carboxylesterase
MIETLRVGEISVLHARPARQAHPPVLFIHGYFAVAELWTEWLELFAGRGVPAYAVNLRGRASSGASAGLGAVSIADFAEDAASIARYLGRPSIVAHSMGGLIAQRLLEQDLARAAVLIAPAPPRGIPLINPRLAIKQLRYLPQVLGSRVLEPNLEHLRELAFNRVPRELQDTALAAMVPDSGRAGREMSLTGVAVDASRVRAPMLVIAAEDDRFIPSAVVARIARRYRATLETIGGHGHMVIIEPGWNSLAERVLRWLAAI